MAAKPKTGLVLLKKKTAIEVFQAGREDPVEFARYFLDRDPHPGQQAWLRRSGDPRMDGAVAKPDAIESVLTTGNRWGKTDASAIDLLWHAFYQIRPSDYRYDNQGRLRAYTAMNISLSLDQAMIAWNYAVGFASDAPRFKQFVVDTQGTPFPCLTIGNGAPGDKRITSGIWARSTAKGAKFLYGKTANFINWDEAAFQPDGAEILDGVIRMRLVDQAGTLALVSAPNGISNWFYQEYSYGLPRPLEDRMVDDPLHYCQRGSTFDNTHIDHESVRRQMQKMSAEQVKQNIYGEFAESSNIFDSISIQNCYRDMDYGHLMGRDGLAPNCEWSIEEADEGLRYGLTRHREKLLHYVVGADLARKRDQTCIIVLKIGDSPTQPAQVVFFELMTGGKWEARYDRIQHVYDRYNHAPILVDSTGLGDVVLERLQQEPYCLDASGYNFAGGREKQNLILALQQAIQDGRIKFPFIRELVDQLTYYSWEDRHLQTDAVMGLALAWQHALNHGMDDSKVSYTLSAPDVAPASISRSLSGGVVVNLNNCAVCSHPLREEIEEYLRNQHVYIDGNVATDVKHLIEILTERHPDVTITPDDIRSHKIHNEPDDDNGFEMQWKQKFSRLLI